VSGETGAELAGGAERFALLAQKGDVRINISVARVHEQGLPTVYVNQVGGRTSWYSTVVSVRPALRLHAGVPARGLSGSRRHDAMGSARRHLALRDTGPMVASGGSEPPDYAACSSVCANYVNKNGFPGVVLRPVRRGVDFRAWCARRWRSMRLDPSGCRCVMLPYKSHRAGIARRCHRLRQGLRRAVTRYCRSSAGSKVVERRWPPRSPGMARGRHRGKSASARRRHRSDGDLQQV